MTTPLLLDTDDTELLWKKLDAKKAENDSKQKASDTIVPDADSLVYDSFYDRLRSIQDRSTSAAQGAIAADQTKKQYEAAVKASQMEKQRQQALQDAYNGMNSIAGGGGFGQPAAYGAGGSAGSWGSGGAQGVANVLRAAGFPESAVPTMMAIAKAESSWNPNATHRNSNGSIDNGLFQINSIHSKNSWYPSNPMDPLQSAIAAYNIWKGAGGTYRDWTVYKSGAYKQYLQAAPPIQPYVAATSSGLAYAQVNQAQNYSGVPTSGARQQAINISKQVLNIPYVWGGTNLAKGVDCSGLVLSVYAKMGISMPRQARAQATTGTRVGSASQLQPGDLVAFKWAGGYAGPNVVSHISIYMGNNQIIEAYGGSKGRIRSLGNSAQDRGAIYIHTRFPGE